MHWEGSELEFPSPFDFRERMPLTLVELRMRRYSGKIRQKPRWWEKIHDEAVVRKWREEMAAHDRGMIEELWSGQERYDHGGGLKKWPRDPITEAQLDYMFAELEYDAGRMDEETGIYASAVPMVYESQSLIPQAIRDAFLDGVAKLEDVPEEEKDWHPGSDKQVLDIVHPSLYPLRIGRNHVLTFDDEGKRPIGTHTLTGSEYRDPPDYRRGYDPHRWALSERFQWLPTDFPVSKTGKVKALGYINNLHPVQHKEMYGTIARVLERFIPLFERVVSDVLSPERPYAVQVNPMQWYKGLPTKSEDDADHEAGREDDYEEWRWYSYKQRVEWPVIPDPQPFSPPSPEEDARRIELQLTGCTLQVIVKLANIVLTPDSPRYPGGSWHVEGMLNERIVATGIYYYACENITESRLAFRHTVGARDPYRMASKYHDQWDEQGVIAAYGLAPHRPLNQEIGHVVAADGKCIAFPNLYQHCVQPFELDDLDRPGYRKILCFFLVDPLNQVLSTSTVLPQQEEWLADADVTRAAMPALRARSLSRKAFSEIVASAREAAMSREEADAVRAELMAERSGFVVDQAHFVYEVDFNMCEH